MSLPTPLARLVPLGVCIAALAHGTHSDACADPVPRRAEVTIHTTTRRVRRAHVMPGEWVLVSSHRGLQMPFSFEGETDVAFQKHGACIYRLKDGKEGALLGVRLGTSTGRPELRSAIKRGTSPLTIWCAVEPAIADVPPLPPGRYYALSAGHVSDLRPVAALRNLSALKVSCAPGLADLSPLARLSNLESLWLCCLDSPDLSPLAALADLTVLHLVCDGKLVDISPLARLQKLRALKIHGARNLANIAPLAALRNLRVLELAGCPNIADIAPLAALTDLTWLDLHGCRRIADLAPLRRMAHLASLDIGDCPQVADLRQIAGLGRLEALDLSNDVSVRDLSPLATLTKLTKLNLLGCTSVHDLWPVREMLQRRPLDVAVDVRLRDQLACVQQAVPSTITVATNGKHIMSVHKPPDHPGEIEPWVNIADGCPSPERLAARGPHCLLYPVHTHKTGSVLHFEWHGPRVLLSVDRGATRLAGVVANSPDGLTTLTEVVQQSNAPLIIWSDARSIECLPPLPAGRHFTLVLMGLGTPLEPLAKVRNLTGLHIQSCASRSADLAPLAHLTALRTLVLRAGPRLTSLEHLARMTRLSSLRVRLAPTVRDLAPLSALAHLRTLQLSCAAPADLAPLATLRDLQALTLEGPLGPNAITTIGKLSRLQVLALHPTGTLSDLAPLAKLTGLRALSLVGCKPLADLRPLAALDGLEVLALRACRRVADITPLTALPKLKRLHIHACDSITDADTLLTLEQRGVALDLDSLLRRQLEMLRERPCQTK